MRSTITGAVLALGTCVALSACGGSGLSTSLPAHAPAAAAPGAPAAPQQSGKVTLSISFPPKAVASKHRSASAARAPRYVSRNSDTIYVSVLSINGTPVSGSSYVYAIPFSTFVHTVDRVNGDDYTATISLPAGQDVLAIGDAESGTLLSYSDGFSVDIVPGQSANLTATLHGVAAAFDTAQLIYQSCSTSGLFCALSTQYDDPMGGLMGVVGAPANAPFTVTATDATNASTAITLSSQGQSGSSIQVPANYYQDTVNIDPSNIPAGETDQVTLQYAFPAITTTDFGSALSLFGGTTQSITFSCTNAGCSANGDLHLTVN